MAPENESKNKYLAYQKIATAINYLAEHYSEQPGLDELAELSGLSPSRFQRVFSQWAGVSPKQFLRYVTKEHALRVLRENNSVLESSAELGLSGGGRLYDLTVTLEAVTPGEISSGGESLQIAYGVHESPYGDCFIAATSRGVCKLAFTGGDGIGELLEELASEWPRAGIDRDQESTGLLVNKIFSRTKTSITLAIKGTNFQLKVWEALLKIPVGGLVSYDDIARDIGNEKASRAVGTAVGRNPVALLIPCHRVIRKTGVIGNYRWGTSTKLAILGCEAASRDE